MGERPCAGIEFDVWVPDAPPCSAEDFEGVALEGATRVIVPAGVRCSSWAAAVLGPPLVP